MIPLLEIPDLLLLSILLKLNALPFARLFSTNKSMKAAIEYQKKKLMEHRKLIEKTVTFYNKTGRRNTKVGFWKDRAGFYDFVEWSSKEGWFWRRGNLLETLCYFKFQELTEGSFPYNMTFPVVFPLEADTVSLEWDSRNRDYIGGCKPITLNIYARHELRNEHLIPFYPDLLEQLKLERIIFRSEMFYSKKILAYLMTVASPFVKRLELRSRSFSVSLENLPEPLGELVQTIVSGKHGRFEHLLVVSLRAMQENIFGHLPDNAIVREIQPGKSGEWLKTWTIPLKNGFILVSRHFKEAPAVNLPEIHIHVLHVTDRKTLSEWNSTYFNGELDVFQIWEDYIAMK